MARAKSSPKAAVDPLHRHLALLGKRDPHIRRVIKEHGLPEPRRTDPGFASLVRIIGDQQVSVAAGKAIFAKLKRACGGQITPKRIHTLGESGLRACGQSGRKAGYIFGIAAAVLEKRLDLVALEAENDETVRATLTALKGIGSWTADIYLLFAMGRPDIWPAADLGLQHGIRMLHRLRTKPTTEMMHKLAEAWRPYRSGAAILLWHYYGAGRKTTATASKRPRKAVTPPKSTN